MQKGPGNEPATSLAVKPGAPLCYQQAGVWESNSRVLPLNANKATFQCLVNILERKPGSFQTARRQQPRTPSQSVIRSCLQREGGTRSPRGNRPACTELWSQHQPLRLCHTERRKDLRQERQASLSSGAQVHPEESCCSDGSSGCWLGGDCPLFVQTLCSLCKTENKQIDKTLEVV